METITNAASAAASTVSGLIYGQPKDTATTGNETAGKEPISGQQGKGTVNEPFDQGNAANPVDASSKTDTFPDSGKDTTSTSGNTSYKADDFLELSPAVGKPTTTEPSTDIKSGTTSDTAIPIVPLNPDVATMGGEKTNTSSTETAITDKAPDFTPAAPETNLTSSTPNETSEHHGVDAIKDSAKTETHQASSAPKKESVNSDIDEILHKTPKAEHSVDDREAESSHAKMTGQTVRHTEPSNSGEGGDAKSLAAETSAHKSESSRSPQPTSSTGGDDKSDSKMSALKDKFKNKLHIGSKDK